MLDQRKDLEPFPPARRSEELARRIHEEICRSGGTITFARFMEMALYEPGLGYYTNPLVTIGREGDFYTASSVHPVFGQTIAAAIVKLWEGLNRPSPFWIVEVGAGEGYLASDILRSIREEAGWFWPHLRYAIVEKSKFLRKRQKERLGWMEEDGDSGVLGKVVWRDSLGMVEPAGFVGCILANELLDAFPVHRVRACKEGLKEIYVTSKTDAEGESDSAGFERGECGGPAGGSIRQFAEATGALSTPKLAKYLADQGVELRAGYEAEINLEALGWLKEAASSLRQGFIIIIDYGDVAARLYDEGHPRGTLLCYRGHAVSENPYQDVGLQDITAHVNFTALLNEAPGLGLSVHTFTTQGRFLIANGILGRVPPARLENGQVVQDPGAERVSRAVLTLVAPDGMGRGFRVLILEKARL